MDEDQTRRWALLHELLDAIEDVLLEDGDLDEGSGLTGAVSILQTA